MPRTLHQRLSDRALELTAVDAAHGSIHCNGTGDCELQQLIDLLLADVAALLRGEA